MIISASRRTDIPAFYSGWFLNRIREGYALVPNPYNSRLLSRVKLTPDVVDCIVFWTKNPYPMLDKLDALHGYPYYFQYTLNPYGKEIEPNLPPLEKRIETFKRLSDKIGKEKVIWRYDPIFTSPEYSIGFHQEAFARIARALRNHTEKCMLGFIDHYPHIRKAVEARGIHPLKPEEIEAMAVSFKDTVGPYPIELNTCTAKVNLAHLGIPGGLCIDGALVERIAGYPVQGKKDKNQRNVCRCIESIDIGMYESCLHGCLYCYAIKGNSLTAGRNNRKHDPASPLLIGTVEEGTHIKDREMKSLKTGRPPETLFFQ